MMKPCEKVKKMPKRTYRLQRYLSAWFYVPVIVVGVLVLLATYGSGEALSAGPTTALSSIVNGSVAHSMPASKPKSVPGAIQTVSIITNSNGSFGFSPAILTVPVGTTVIWKNTTSVPHTVTSDNGRTFNSGPISPGGTFSFKFTTAARYPYHCNIHPYMRAIINS